MTTISHYGVFMSAGIPYLHQDPKGIGFDCLDQGLASPFVLDLPSHLKRANVPHAMNLQAGDVLPEGMDDFFNNALVDLYLPKPNLEGTTPRVVFIKNKTMDPFPYLKRLSELCSMNAVATVIFESGMEDQYRNQLRLTNLGPLSLIGISVKSSMPVYNLTEFAKISFRNLILTGHQDIPMPKDAEDFTDAYNALVAMMSGLPPSFNLRAIGSQFFKKWMMYQHESTNHIPTQAQAD